MVCFVLSCYLGLYLGTWVYVEWLRGIREDAHGPPIFPKTHMWLIDGQQRLTALDRYFDDAFPVFGHLWSQLPRLDQRRLLDRTFPCQKIELDDEDHLREVYDRLNFGGVAYTEDERATR